MIRKILSIVLLGIFALVGAGTADRLTFAWDDSNAKSQDYEWLLYMSDQSGVFDYDNPLTIIPYESGDIYTHYQNVTVTGVPGSIVRRYFVLRARSGEDVSGDSNEVFADIKIPLEPPFSLTVEITTMPN